MQSPRPRLPDLEAQYYDPDLYDPAPRYDPDAESLFTTISSSSSSILTDMHIHDLDDPGDPSNAFDAWAAQQALLSLLSGLFMILRMAYHLASFTAGLYLASAAFSALAPLLDHSMAFAPLVIVLVAAAVLAAPCWGLLLSYAARHLLPSLFAPWDVDAHTRRCLLSIGLGLGLAALRVLVALAVLVDSTAPCGEWSVPCLGATALAFVKQVAAVWADITADLSRAIAVALAPLAAAWFLAWRLKPDAPAPHAHYAFVALKAAVVLLTLANIWLTLSLGKQNAGLRRDLDVCKSGTRRVAAAEGVVAGVLGNATAAAQAHFGQ